jgi:hypothetical protein
VESTIQKQNTLDSTSYYRTEQNSKQLTSEASSGK